MNAKDPIATRMVADGVALLAESPYGIAARGLRAEDVIERSGTSQATFYRKFATKIEYLDAVIGSLSESVEEQSSRTLAKYRQLKTDAHVSRPGDLVAELAAWRFDDLTRREASIRHLLALTHARSHQGLRTDLSAAYAAQVSTWSRILADIGNRTEMTLRRPHSYAELAQVMTAMIDGLALRSYVAPRSAVPTHRTVGAAARALMEGFLTRESAFDALEDVVEHWEPIDPQESRRVLINAARELFRAYGYTATSIETISEDARIPERITRRLFPTKAHLLVHALKAFFNDFSEAIEDDILIQLDLETVLTSHLTRLAELTINEPVFMQIWMTQAVHDVGSEPLWKDVDFCLLTQRIIDQARPSADAALPSSSIARVMTAMLVNECLARPERAPYMHVVFCLAFLPAGVFGRESTPENDLKARQDSDQSIIDAMMRRANLEHRLGRSEAAKSLFQQAADAGNIEAMVRLGQLAVELGHREDAEHWFRASADAGNIEAMVRLGQLLQELRQFTTAEQWYVRAADRGNIESMVRLGQLLQELGRFAEAESWYGRAADTGNVEAMVRLGQLARELNHSDEAMYWYARAADAGNIEAMVRLGQLALELNHSDEAEHRFRYAATAGNVEGMLRLGELLEKLGNHDEAELWYGRAADTGDLEAMMRLGQLLQELGHLDEAEHWFHRASEGRHPKT